MDTKRICSLIEERKEELFELLSSLVKINSENFSTGGNEEECANYIDKLCRELGLESDVYSPMELPGFSEHPDYIPGHNLENRPNVVARWRGEENVDELMLMAHTDTVVIGDLDSWELDPLSGIVRDGKIFGRGSCDDKYGVATALFIIKLLKEEGFFPKKNLLFAGYCDEERGGSHGAMAAVMKYPCKRIVSMDGREGQIWHCASGGGELKYLFHTKETVDSAKNAAMALPVVLEVIETFADKRREELDANPYYAGTIIPQTSLRYMGVRAGNHGADLGKGEVHFQFYTDKVKDEIYAELHKLEAVLTERLAPLGIVGDGFVPETRFFHYVHTTPDSEDITNMLAASREATGEELRVCGSCLSDLSVISKYGSSYAFAFGAGRDFSKEGGAHQPNEYMLCDKLVNYAKTIAAYVIRILG
ncbi:MAG: M20 family metallopeptidase [Ruminococcaceae bacterium]|nr:M20 family metallopeptidase [Oscillospiraceae bacterium]